MAADGRECAASAGIIVRTLLGCGGSCGGVWVWSVQAVRFWQEKIELTLNVHVICEHTYNTAFTQTVPDIHFSLPRHVIQTIDLMQE